MADIKTTDVDIMCHVDESTIPETVDKVTIHLIKGSSVPDPKPTIELEVATLQH